MNKANGKFFKWDDHGPAFEVFVLNIQSFSISCCYLKETDSDFKWSFNTCLRSSQEPTGPISQKLQAKSDPDERCLKTADRFNTTGSELWLYPCQTINPIDGCFKFKESK